MARGVTTKDKFTRAGIKLNKALKQAAKGPGVKVGILQNDFGTSREGEKTVGEVALDNEFGSETNPERSFMRSTADKKQKAWLKLAERIQGQVMGGKISLKKGLGLLGFQMKADIQAAITAKKDPPNSPATIARKGVDNPLIDTGQMRQAIDFEVEMSRKGS